MAEIYVLIGICFVAGIGLLTVEVFLPGFGLPGISGVILCAVSIGVTWANFGGMAALGITIVVLAVIAIAVSIALRSASNGRLAKSGIFLKDTESLEEGYSASEDLMVFLGREGVTTTVMRPTGIAEFDGVRLNVMTDGDFMAANTKVKIVSVEGSRIVVKSVEQ
jgi:Membrane-bound serine protease (ClpP class)